MKTKGGGGRETPLRRKRGWEKGGGRGKKGYNVPLRYKETEVAAMNARFCRAFYEQTGDEPLLNADGAREDNGSLVKESIHSSCRWGKV